VVLFHLSSLFSYYDGTRKSATAAAEFKRFVRHCFALLPFVDHNNFKILQFLKPCSAQRHATLVWVVFKKLKLQSSSRFDKKGKTFEA
jgi:hypothetical protein